MQSEDLDAKRMAVLEEFSQAGLSLKAPHLNSGAAAPRL